MNLFVAVDDFMLDRVFQPIINKLYWFGDRVEICRFILTGYIVAVVARAYFEYISSELDLFMSIVT